MNMKAGKAIWTVAAMGTNFFQPYLNAISF